MQRPRFSVVISTFNREEIILRCVRSVLASEFDDYEVVVVDDGSADGTLPTLNAIHDPRLRVVAHDRNRGMSQARRTGVDAATGEWIVVLDSDWELKPDALTQIDAVIPQASAHGRVLWFRLLWDTGVISPTFIPDHPVKYAERLKWWNSEGGLDAVRCVHRDVFSATPYAEDRRGAMDMLYELDLARNETAVYLDAVIGLQHFDAANSWLRAVDPSTLVPRLVSEAPDMLWMADTALHRHGDALGEYAPTLLTILVRLAASQALIAGKRHTGLLYGLRAVRLAPKDPTVWVTIALGLISPTLLIRAIVTQRQLIRAYRKRRPLGT